MRLVYGSTVALTLALIVPAGLAAQQAGQGGSMAQGMRGMKMGQEEARKITDGGIHAAGWKGMVDPSEAKRGSTVNDAKLEMQGKDLHVTTGPAITYWKEGDTASGDYTVKATFNEPKYMNLNTHPHPYGIVIAGNNMGTDQASYLYCAAYGDGRFIVRGFGPAPFQLNGREGEENAAIHKASGKGEPVSQEIAMSVKGDTVTCSVNGTVVGTYKKSDLTGAGKLKSLDGAYGIRFAHNTEGTVSGLTVTK